MWGFLRQDCTSCVPNRQWLYTSARLSVLVFGSPVAAYLNLQSKPEDRDEKMGVKCSSSDWCSLEQAIFGHTGLPVCLHHIRGPQTLPVLLGHAGRVDIHPFFKTPSQPSDQTSPDTTHSLIFEVAGGRDEDFLYYLFIFLKGHLDNIVILFDRWEKTKYSHIKVNVLLWSWHSPSFSLSTSSEMCFRQPQSGNDKEQVLSCDASRWEDLCRRVCVYSYMLIIVPAVSVSLSQALASHRVYVLTARIPAKVGTAVCIWSVVRWT